MNQFFHKELSRGSHDGTNERPRRKECHVDAYVEKNWTPLAADWRPFFLLCGIHAGS
jgi:hypothetical protein